MKKITTSVDIAATPAAVWQVLTDLASFHDWNPWIVRAEGEVVPGARLTLRIKSPGGRAMTFRPRVTHAGPRRAVEWLGHLVVPGLFDGRHHIQLETTRAGTRLVHSETFTGVLVPLFSKALDSSTRAGFVAMNQALRDRAEAGVGSGV